MKPAAPSNTYDMARSRMIREQLTPRGIVDQRVLEAMAVVPRHIFVEDAMRGQAYGDFPLPIGDGQTISQPYIVALMTQALGLKGHEKVLEIGTGCGYQTAILSLLASQVYTIERLRPLQARARHLLDQLQCLNVVAKRDDGTHGWPQYGPFDAIMVTAAGPKVPQPLLDQLADPGRMVIPVGDRISQQLVVVRKENGMIIENVIEQVRFVSLIGNHGWQND